MKQHSEDFKNQVAELGRQFSSKLIYGNTELVEELYSVTPHFKGNMLKSTMKQLDVETTEDIPIGTEVNYQLGLLIEDEYEWLDYGNYIVYSSEKQEDKGTYKLICYDKLLNSMKTYEGIDGAFPMTLREYLQAICDKLDIDFGSANDDFANYNIEIPEDRYTGLQEYTYRDVLDEIAQATGSMICLNSDDELIVKYINEGIDNYNTVEGTSFTLEDASGGLGSSITKLEGNTTQSGTPTPTNPIPIYTVSGDNEVVVCGKNRFNYNGEILENYINGSGMTYSVSNGEYTLNGSNTRTYIYIRYDTVLPAGTYFFSGCPSGGSTNGYSGLLQANGTNYFDFGSGVSFTLNAETTVKVYPIRVGGSRITVNNLKFKTQLEKGNTKTSFEPYTGNSYRVDFGGKNLFNKEIPEANKNVRLNTSGGFYSDTGYFISDAIEVLPNTQYTVNYTVTTLSRICYYTGKSVSTFISKNDSNATFTTPSNCYYVRFCNLLTNIDTIQLEKGTVATEYSPYVSNPIELCKIGNYRDSIKKSSGKQLFNKDNINKLNAYFESNNVITASNYNRIFYIECEPNTTYTIAQNPSTSPISNHLLQVATSSVLPEIGVECTSNHNIGGDTSYTMTTNADAKYLVFRIRSGDDIEGYLSTIMINKGTTALPYEPYGNNWYIEKNIGKVVLDGNTTGWSGGIVATDVYRFYRPIEGIKARTENTRYIDRFITDRFKLSTNNEYGASYQYHDNLYFCVSSNEATTGDSFKTWLSTHNITVYFVLATPSYEIIDNENLIQQLENIQNIELIENLCYVDWVGTEKPTMTLKYYQGRTLEEINEEYLKDVNVDFGEKYGPVNSIVLSRSGESDNVYIQDEDSIEENGLHELKIVDNQLMNFNDRSDYLQDLLDKLDGLEYYINDYTSTGICYLELGDRYYVHIGDNTYSCVMFNDEIDITTGLEELIYTEMPEETETDYTKADKTDRKINQTYIIVDKQNQQIQSLVNEVGDRSQKTTTITQDIDGIEELLASTVDVTRDDESYNATVSIAEVNLSEPVEIRVKPTTSPGISYLYPRANLYPSDTLYPSERKIRFVRTYEENGTTKTENIDYELPDNLLYYSQSAYDEFVLDYLNKECKIIKKCAYNANGQVVLTGSTETIQYEYPTITLPEGDYEVKILGYNVGYIYARLMIQNEYTKLFTTEVETETSIAIKEREIMANVSQEYETKGEAATQYAQIQVTTDGIQSEVANKVGNDEVVSKINQSAETVSIQANKININGVISANGNFRVDRSGNMTANNGTFTGGKVALYGGSQSNPTFSIEPTNDNNSYLLLGHNFITLKDGTAYLTFNKDFWQIGDIASGQGIQTMGNSSIYFKTPKGDFSGQVYSYGYNTYSKESMKKDFEKLGDVSSIIKNSQLYSYHYKTENDKDKKHIGFVIADEGGDFKTPKEVIINNESIDMYSMCSILWKAVQEQQEKIEELENKLKEDK